MHKRILHVSIDGRMLGARGMSLSSSSDCSKHAHVSAGMHANAACISQDTFCLSSVSVLQTA